MEEEVKPAWERKWRTTSFGKQASNDHCQERWLGGRRGSVRWALSGCKGSLFWFFPFAHSVHVVVDFLLQASVKDHDFVFWDGRSTQ